MYDVGGDGAKVGDVVVHPSGVVQLRPPGGLFGRHPQSESLFHGHRVGKAVADGSVAADAFGQGNAVERVTPFEEFLDAAVGEPEAGTDFEDRFADDGEAEVSGFEETGVYGAEREHVAGGTPARGAQATTPPG